MTVDHTFKLACALTLGLLALPLTVAQEKPGFKTVEPIFQEKCVACHNPMSRQGGFDMET
jgi:hypothetical protein